MTIENASFQEFSINVPEKDSNFVEFGHYKDIKSIVESKSFYPIYISGMSGNGKTFMVEQICAALGVKLIRVNFTKETGEEELFGGFRLHNGNTEWFYGPVIRAMEEGAILLLDEIDLGSNQALCLQPVLEGKSIFLKKVNKYVHPAPGFNIIATANTKGKGDDNGKFIGVNILNEAFLERFPLTFEQDYPKEEIEKSILEKYSDDLQFNGELVNWANLIRNMFKEGAIDELISTRRLVHIIKAYKIFKFKKKKAIELCINRFDDSVKTAFLDLFEKISKESLEEAPAPVDDLRQFANEKLDDLYKTLHG